MSARLRLVGTPAEERGGRLVPLAFERRWQMVVLLALRAGWMQRAELAAMLWPDQPAAQASTNLRKALFRLRDTAWAAALEGDGSLLRLACDTDVAAFGAQPQAGHSADTLQAYRGELLEGFDDPANEPWTDWLRTQRDRWRQRWRDAVLQRLAAPLAAAEGLRLADLLLQADPLDEAALQAQLHHLEQSGQALRAHEVYQAFAKRLQQELDVQPGAALRARYDALSARPPAPASAVVTAGTDATAAADDGYVGRVVEQRRIAELMRRPECRLLAIVGPGGMGKTRLARRALADVAPLFADGAAFVALEDVESAPAFVSRVAQRLELQRPRTRDEFDALADHLAPRQLLLVLDNFEPVAATATPLLGRLLEHAPQLKIIVTSRERLALGAQWALLLEGLPCPEPEDMDRLDDFDASRLFLAAARRADPAFDAQAECAAVVDICRQVDGLPLALELAASWVRVMRCDDIARELRQGTELLRATNPAFPARQASLEAVFEQSWQLLGEPERQALARLSVFRGGFTVESARAVTGARLPVLGALTDQSLLRKDGTRLALHPLVHQFAALKLGDGDAHAAARAAHALHVAALLTERLAALQAGDGEALRRVDQEFENGRRALEWLADQGPAAALTGSAWALAEFTQHRGQAQRGLDMVQAALDGALARQDRTVRSRLMCHAAQQQFRLDRFGESIATARAALTLAGGEETERSDHGRRLLTVLGSAALRMGRLDEARERFSAILALGDEVLTARDRAVTLDHLSLIERRLGRVDEALRLALEALVMQRRLGDVAALALSVNNLGSLYLQRHEPDAAEPALREALALAEGAGLSTTRCLVLSNLGEVALLRGDLAGAQRHALQGAALAEAGGQRLLLGWMQALLGTIALRHGDVGAARLHVAGACATALALEAPTLKGAVVLALARLFHHDGHAVAAGRVLALGQAEPTLSVADRDELRRQQQAWGGEAAPAPALRLDALLQRAAAEADSGHAALTSALEG